MLNITIQNGTPIKLKLAKGVKLDVGNIVKLTNDNGVISCILSDGKDPFGLIVEVNGDMVSVLCCAAIFQTDKFDNKQNYNSGDFIYANASGLLTNSKMYDNSLLLGRVIKGTEDEQGIIEVSWI